MSATTDKIFKILQSQWNNNKSKNITAMEIKNSSTKSNKLKKHLTHTMTNKH